MHLFIYIYTVHLYTYIIYTYMHMRIQHTYIQIAHIHTHVCIHIHIYIHIPWHPISNALQSLLLGTQAVRRLAFPCVFARLVVLFAIIVVGSRFSSWFRRNLALIAGRGRGLKKSIHDRDRCQPIPIEHPRSRSIHRCQPSNVGFPKHPRAINMHCCQPRNVGFLES